MKWLARVSRVSNRHWCDICRWGIICRWWCCPQMPSVYHYYSASVTLFVSACIRCRLNYESAIYTKYITIFKIPYPAKLHLLLLKFFDLVCTPDCSVHSAWISRGTVSMRNDSAYVRESNRIEYKVYIQSKARTIEATSASVLDNVIRCNTFYCCCVPRTLSLT